MAATATKLDSTAEAFRRLAIARSGARRKAPYYGHALLSLVPRPAPGLGTVATTAKSVLLFDPETVTGWSDAEFIGALLHEVLHQTLRTFSRQGERDHKLWNIASDLPINQLVKALGAELPKGALFPSIFGFAENLTAEAYYDLLRQKQQNGEKPAEKAGKGPGQGACGSCAGGSPSKAEAEADAEDGRSSADVERVARQTAQAVRDYASAKGRGSVPGRIVEWATAALEPSKVPWNTKLAVWLRDGIGRRVVGDVDYTRARPGRRSWALGGDIPRPSLYTQLPEICLVVDSSGSMGRDVELAQALREAAAVLQASSVEDATSIECDCEIQGAPRRVRAADLKKVALRGRGGTDFRPIFEAVQKLDPKPQIVLVFTDGDGAAPETPPRDMAVAWVVVGGHERPPADWGFVVRVEA